MGQLKQLIENFGWNISEDDFEAEVRQSFLRLDEGLRNRSFGVISTHLHSDSAEVANRAYHELRESIRKAGFGYTQVRYVRDPEPSFLVIGYKDEPDRNRLKNFLIRHGKLHRQLSVIYEPYGSEDAMEIYTRDDPQSGHKFRDEEDLGIGSRMTPSPDIWLGNWV